MLLPGLLAVFRAIEIEGDPGRLRPEPCSAGTLPLRLLALLKGLAGVFQRPGGKNLSRVLFSSKLVRTSGRPLTEHCQQQGRGGCGGRGGHGRQVGGVARRRRGVGVAALPGTARCARAPTASTASCGPVPAAPAGRGVYRRSGEGGTPPRETATRWQKGEMGGAAPGRAFEPETAA